MEEDETAYERLLHKVKENKDSKTKKVAATTPKKRKLSVAAKDAVEPSVSKRNTSASARFFEDDNFVNMTVDMNEFPSEDDNLSEDEGDEVSFNNNAMVVTVVIDRMSNPIQKDGRSERSARADSTMDHWPSMSIPQGEHEECNRSSLSMELMQNYLLKSGVIQSMSKEEIQEILQQEPNVQGIVRQQPAETEPRRANLPSSSAKGSKQLVTGRKNDYLSSESEVTLYKRVVHQINPDLERQIKGVLNQCRENSSKCRSSSDGAMDTSDELGDNHPFNFNDLGISDGMEPSRLTQSGIQQQAQQLQTLAATPEEQADELIKDSE